MKSDLQGYRTLRVCSAKLLIFSAAFGGPI
jgi:hypothetical protein